MSSIEPPSLLPPLRRLLSLASRLVPRRLRAEWRREWEAELIARWTVLTRWGRQASGPARREVIRRARGAFLDAGWLRIRELREGILLDLRLGLRRLRREPGFALTVLSLLGLGIGANTVFFSTASAVLLAPLPYPEADRLVRVWETHETPGSDRERPSPGNFQEWRRRTSLRGGRASSEQPFDGMASWYVSSMTLQGDVSRDAGPAETRTSAQVSNDFFHVAGVAPALGRTFTDEEVDRSVFSSSNTHIGAGPVVVLSDRLWRQHFGADPEIVGRKIRIERKDWQVVGVMPPRFELPSPEVDLWVPWSFAHERPRDQRYTQVMARLAPGTSLETARARLDAVAAEMAQLYPETNRGWGVRLTRLRDELLGAARPALGTLLAAVVCVLLIICFNVAGLQLVRHSTRGHETVVRVALGASRPRLIRQGLIEALVLAGGGGALGVVLARWAVEAVNGLDISSVPRLGEVRLDPGVLAFTAGVTLATALLFGLGPALVGSSFRASRILRHGGTGGTTARPRQRLRHALVVVEVALTVVLLVSAGLLARSFLRLSAVDPGFRTENVLVLPILLDGNEYGTAARSSAYYRELTERLAALPGIEAVGGATALPSSPVGPDFERPVWREGHRPPVGEGLQANIRIVTPGYLKTLEIPVLRGRSFDSRDTAESEPVLMVNETLMRRLWGNGDPVGRSLVLDYGPAGTRPYRVVGVAADIRFYGPRSQPRGEVYFPHRQRPYLILNMAVRTSGGPTGRAEAIRREVLALDPQQPVHSITPLSRRVDGALERERWSATLMTTFAGMALLLSAIGLYGLVSYQVARRAREIGIRRALGARAADVVRVVAAHGIPPVLTGLLLGSGVALSLTRLLSSQLFGVPPHDPATFGVVAGLLLAAATLATWLPARRAARVDPAVVLKEG